MIKLVMPSDEPVIIPRIVTVVNDDHRHDGITTITSAAGWDGAEV